MREALASTTLTSLPREASDLSRPPEHSDRFDLDALGNFCAALLLRPLEKPGRTWHRTATARTWTVENKSRTPCTRQFD